MSRRTRRTGLVALTGVLAATALALPAAAHPASDKAHRVAVPHGIRLVNVSPSSFQVESAPTENAKRYRVFASTKRSNLFTANVSRAQASALFSHPQVRIAGLHYTTRPYYYRLEAVNGSRHRFSRDIYELGLQPPSPTGLTVRTSAAGGTYLTWDSSSATGFLVTVARNPAMTQGRVNYRLTSNTHQFSPPHLVAGRTYYFRVRALNDATRSADAASANGTAGSKEQRVRVMTYNVLEAFDDGRLEGSGRVAPWSKRKVRAAALIRKAHPDVVAVQEAASWVKGVRGPRQIDSLRAQLHGVYALAHTEIPPSQPHYLRTGVYILYRKSQYRAVGHGGHWGLGNRRWAAYQILADRATGAKFLFVDPHLLVGPGRANDVKRKHETQRLVSRAKAKAKRAGVPLVYAGDFNSDQTAKHPLNAPEMVMSTHNVVNTFAAAPVRTNAEYNSANGYERRPPRFGDHIDYVFAAPSVSVLAWHLLLDLHHGEFSGVIPSDHNPLVVDLQYPY
ncbi:MAG TPA: endonuclease/exonuclease/phosphatase family protein [Mycobacteriales bacterium]|nr:endonuclease/exonuclease/phosphatase family protein [Mycobacteriales bacterium]